MKTLFFALLTTCFFVACGNDNSDTEVKSAPVTPGIDNVEGNIPDTTRAIRLERPLPEDSSRVDDSAAH